MCIDLDQTLAQPDLFLESLLVFFRQNPFNLILSIVWLVREIAQLNEKLAARVILDVSRLPYYEPMLELTRKEAAQGRCVILVTASNHKYANEVASHLGLFNKVMASTAEANLSAGKKAETLVRSLGEKTSTTPVIRWRTFQPGGEQERRLW